MRTRTRTRTRAAPLVADVRSSTLFSPSSKFAAGPGRLAPESRIPVLFGPRRTGTDPVGARCAAARKLRRHSSSAQKRPPVLDAEDEWAPAAALNRARSGAPTLFGRLPPQPSDVSRSSAPGSPDFDASALFSQSSQASGGGLEHASPTAVSDLPSGMTGGWRTRAIPHQPRTSRKYTMAMVSPEITPVAAAVAEVGFSPSFAVDPAPQSSQQEDNQAIAAVRGSTLVRTRSCAGGASVRMQGACMKATGTAAWAAAPEDTPLILMCQRPSLPAQVDERPAPGARRQPRAGCLPRRAVAPAPLLATRHAVPAPISNAVSGKHRSGGAREASCDGGRTRSAGKPAAVPTGEFNPAGTPATIGVLFHLP